MNPIHPLPENTMLSSSSIGDWLRCRRLFQYRHIQRRTHPAPQTDDMLAFEEYTERGAAFHHMASQHFSGVDAATLRGRIHDVQLAAWWAAFEAHVLPTIPARRYAETPLTAPLAGHRLLAKYDLIAVDPDARKMMIYDWKTTRKPPARATLAERAQTQVYRYLMVRAGAYYLDWAPVEPEQVEMVYWFAADPTQPERFAYDRAQYERDEAALSDIIAEIAAERAFPTVDPADRERVCRYCVYRTLCWDDVQAGAFDGLLDDDTPASSAADGGDEIDLDFGQIAEVQF